jgi:hypothetical protein
VKATGFLEFMAIDGRDSGGAKEREGTAAIAELIAGFSSTDWKLTEELTEVRGDDVMEASFAGDRGGFKSDNDDAEASDPDEYELRSRVIAMFLGISRLYGKKTQTKWTQHFLRKTCKKIKKHRK